MKETGILFTPENHRLIISGDKVQTRRVVKPQPDVYIDRRPYWNIGGYRAWEWTKETDILRMGTNNPLKCPYGNPGDKLYIKEGVIRHASIPQLVGYYMDGCRVTEPWMVRRTAMFMPKSMARTWLELIEVRVERLNDISEEDALAEGIEEYHRRDCKVYSTVYGSDGVCLEPGGCTCPNYSEQELYADLWDSINAKKHPWSQNDLVWALTFKKL